MDNKPDLEKEVRKEPGVQRVYRNDEIAVLTGRYSCAAPCACLGCAMS